MTNIIIYHNPACGTSRNVLEIIRNSGEDLMVIEYLKTPPSRADLLNITKQIPVRELLRQKGTPYHELELDDSKWTDAQLVDFILEYPILMNRPVVITKLGAKLCRPAEEILEIFPTAKLPADKGDKNSCEI